MNSHTSLSSQALPNWQDKWAKDLLLNIFRRLPQGRLLLKEKGSLVEHFGQNNAGDFQAEINIIEPATYRRLLLGGSVAAGETYTDGAWTSPDLTKVIRLFARNMAILDVWESRFEWLMLPWRKLTHLKNKNSLAQSKNNIAAHYDLGNKLYRRFLDDSMLYSAAMYPNQNASLAEAQQHKLQRICEKLALRKEDHLLEIGTGWGALAIHAAKHFGCRVTTTTISEEQHKYAEQWIAKEGLQQHITLLRQDYRQLEGQFDKLVSIEMIEAVGKEYLPTFFKTCAARLKANGLMLLQAITINDQRYDSYSNGVDFIQKYIFPGGFLPSQLMINQQLKQHTDMMMRDQQDIGLDYAATLMHWRQNFDNAETELLRDGYDQRFIRLWRFYLAYCEGGFRERTISTVQLLLTKPGYAQPLMR